MEVGLRIKELREECGLTQSELAKKINNLNQSQICKIENGQRAIKLEELLNICNALNIPLSKLIS